MLTKYPKQARPIFTKMLNAEHNTATGRIYSVVFVKKLHFDEN